MYFWHFESSKELLEQFVEGNTIVTLPTLWIITALHEFCSREEAILIICIDKKGGEKAYTSFFWKKLQTASDIQIFFKTVQN